MEHKLPATKIYGERNTGTDYLAALVEMNLGTRLLPGTIPKDAVNRRGDARWRDRLGRRHWNRLVQRRVDRYFERQFVQTRGWKLGAAFACVNVVYEEPVGDPARGVDAIANGLALVRRRSDVVNLEESTKGDEQTFDSYRDYYVDERWRAELSAGAVRLVNERLDRAVCEGYGYELLDPAAV